MGFVILIRFDFILEKYKFLVICVFLFWKNVMRLLGILLVEYLRFFLWYWSCCNYLVFWEYVLNLMLRLDMWYLSGKFIYKEENIVIV